jgi:hypothetical protein
MRSGGSTTIANGEAKIEAPTQEQQGGPREADGAPVGPTETEQRELKLKDELAKAERARLAEEAGAERGGAAAEAESRPTRRRKE